jgi:hypothetical protein
MPAIRDGPENLLASLLPSPTSFLRSIQPKG